jgi:hypothetical protein
MNSRKPRPSYNFPKWPGNGGEDDDERNEVIPKTALVFYHIKNIFLGLAPTDGDDATATIIPTGGVLSNRNDRMHPS